MEDIDKRLDEITEELAKEEVTSEEIKSLEEETDKLLEERKELELKVEERKETLRKVINSNNVVEKCEERKESNIMENNYSTKEYRSAFFKALQGKELNEEERAFTATGSVLPTETQNNVITRIAQVAPLLNEIELLRVPGNITFAVEGTKAAAALHTENGNISDAGDTLVTVSLAGYEVCKLIQISDTVKQMSIETFENWLVNQISESVANKIEDLIINGTGTSQAKGVNAITWSGTNSVTVAKTSSLAATDVRNVISLLPGSFDNGAKFLMRKSTLFSSVMALQDNAKHDLVRCEGGKYYIYGYEIMLSDYAPANEIILGNFKKYVGNLAEDVNVKSAYDIKTNSMIYNGVAIFDGKPAIESAFVKIVKATN